MDESLDDLVRRVDEDRWLAARFAPRGQRPLLAALYALNYEIARTAETVKTPALGDIKLAWWRDQIAAIHGGAEAPAHPALRAYAGAAPGPAMAAAWEALIAARAADLEEQPFDGWSDLQTYVEATAGGVFKLAIEACLEPEAPRPKQLDLFCAKAGQAWGYAGLVRALPFWTARRGTYFPRKLMTHVGLSAEALFSGQQSHAVRSAAMAVIDRARHALGEARELASMLPPTAFPAYGYLALAKRYLRVLSAPNADPNETQSTPLLVRQATLVAASATGRL